MGMGSQRSAETLHFLRTIEQPCAYLATEKASNLLADPSWPMDASAYAVLLANGFRRSGDSVYRPSCPACEACVPVRIPVHGFTPSRSQRRTLKANADVHYRTAKPDATEPYLALYQKYMHSRHLGSDMASASPEQFLGFLDSSWCHTVFLELWLGSDLIAVAVTDQADNALSAVYTFFDPTYTRRSLGKLAILLQLQIAEAHSLKWLYLGYSIAACQNMAYKTEFRPHQRFIGGVWQPSDGG
ncbi:MAG: arginyltransferase [Pseudomonadota bacterium]